LGQTLTSRERHESPGLLVPQDKWNTGEALPDAHPAIRSETGVVAKHFRQSIKWNAAVQMMNVMDPDVGGEPTQDRREVIERAAI
jgi:hypothetical protein